MRPAREERRRSARNRVRMSACEPAAFAEIAPYYDRLMRDVPYRMWVRYLHELIARHPVHVRRVLDLACGTGNVAEILARMGYEVTGVDIAPAMIAQARAKAAKRNLDIAYHVMDAAEMHVPGVHFDLCICLFDSLNYILDPDRMRRAVRRVYEHLRPNGLFAFDVNSVFALENGFFDQQDLNTRERLRYVWRSEYDSSTRRCTVRMRFFWRGDDDVDHEFNETHVQHAYEESELRDALTRAGFVDVEAFHAYTTRPVRAATDRIFFLARRPEDA